MYIYAPPEVCVCAHACVCIYAPQKIYIFFPEDYIDRCPSEEISSSCAPQKYVCLTPEEDTISIFYQEDYIFIDRCPPEDISSFSEFWFVA